MIRNCPVCGERIDDDHSECFNCGAVIPPPKPNQVTRSKDANKSPLNDGGKSQSLSFRLMGLFLSSLIIIICCGVNSMGGFVDWFLSILPTERFSATTLPEISTTMPEDQDQKINTPISESTAINLKTPTATSFVPMLPQVYMKPSGMIVFTCQIRGEGHNQICIINADGSGWDQLTDNDGDNWYPSVAPDGRSVVYSSNISGRYQIYEVSAAGGVPIQVNYNFGGNLYAPEISPDGSKIAFTHDERGVKTIWIMNRDGINPRRISPDDGWDPTWSPDGTLILFSSFATNGSVQLFAMREDGTDAEQVSSINDLIGRSDMSPSGESVATFAGKYGTRSIYLISLESLDPVQYFFPPTSASPSFSPDGRWIAFTGYIDSPEDLDRGCEIYITRLEDPMNVVRLTNNDYCDWQPRWGP